MAVLLQEDTYINAVLDLLHMSGLGTFACKHVVCCKSRHCMQVCMALSLAGILSCFEHLYACAGFVTFVLRLQKRMYMYQFGQYAWTHMILLVVFIPSSFFVSNIFDGLMWFLLPCSLVIINDIGAYLFGKQLAHMSGTAPNCIYSLAWAPCYIVCTGMSAVEHRMVGLRTQAPKFET